MAIQKKNSFLSKRLKRIFFYLVFGLLVIAGFQTQLNQKFESLAKNVFKTSVHLGSGNYFDSLRLAYDEILDQWYDQNFFPGVNESLGLTACIKNDAGLRVLSYPPFYNLEKDSVLSDYCTDNSRGTGFRLFNPVWVFKGFSDPNIKILLSAKFPIISWSLLFVLAVAFGIITLIQNIASKLSQKNTIISQQIAQIRESETRKEYEKIVSEIASQVAHDIKSPLAVLDMVCDSKFQNETFLHQAHDAIKKIKNIVYDLSVVTIQKGSSFQEKMAQYLKESAEPAPTPLDVIIEKVLQFKRYEYRARLEVSLKYESHLKTKYDPIGWAIPEVFERILSNICDNAYEALVKPGMILVSLTERNDFYDIEIIDTGIGIAEDLLPRIGSPGATFGKKNGSGLGIYYAKNNLLKWGGSLSLSSKKGFGTRVCLSVKKSHNMALGASDRSAHLTSGA